MTSRVLTRLVGVVAGVVVAALVAGTTVMAFQVERGQASPSYRCVSPLALHGDLHSNPHKVLVAQMLVGSAEYSTVQWEDKVGALYYNVEGSEVLNRGYTGGIIGFTSKTSSMSELVRRYVERQPYRNPLAPYVAPLEAVNGTPDTTGLGPGFEQAWREAGQDPVFREVQLELAHEWYLAPALKMASQDGLRSLGQFAYYDAMIHHGESGFRTIHLRALEHATPPSSGGEEADWLEAFFSAREEYMLLEVSPSTATRVSTAQRGLLADGELELRAPLRWEIYGDAYALEVAPTCSGG